VVYFLLVLDECLFELLDQLCFQLELLLVLLPRFLLG
jgi:hypothetical protein